MRGLDPILMILGCLAVCGGIGVAGEVAPLPAPLLSPSQEAVPIPRESCPPVVTLGEVPIEAPMVPACRPFAGWLGLTTRVPSGCGGIGGGGLRQRQGAKEPDDSIWWGEAMGVPTFNWGYFGIPGRKYMVGHEGYYGDYREWGVRRGY